MASVPSVTLDRVDLVVCEVADAIIAQAKRSSSHPDKDELLALTSAFSQFAEGVAILIGPANGPTEETA